MKVHRLIAVLSVLLLLLLILPIKVNCQNYIEYKIKINPDSSAAWTITKFSDLNAPIDTWQNFQTRIFNLVDSASSLTARSMQVDENSLQINTTVSAGSKTTEYLFVWQNFSTIKNGALSFGDVFKVPDFFTQLYGDASVQISYPSDFNLKSTSPTPNERDDSAKTLKWFSAETLATNNPSISLTAQGDAIGVSNNAGWEQYVFVIVALAVVASSLAAFYVYKQRRISVKVAKTEAPLRVVFEEGDAKIVGLLKASGGTMRQSAIVEQSRFSKAKTSQLLAALERRGNITRYKRGRDKIVVLKESGVVEKL
jgi:uncharacterized membrane protein